jgi:hypothetical protein
LSEIPALSVILPVHNGMPYVIESIRSILDQTFENFALVIGNDGSTDGTDAAIEHFAQSDGRIRLLRRKQPSGLAESANWLVRDARSPIVAIAHADDRSYPDRLKRQITLLRSAPEIDLVGTLWDGIDEEGRKVRPGDYWRVVRQSRFAPFSHSSIMFRRASFERAGGYRAAANYWEDLDLYYRIAAFGRIAVISEVLASVRHARCSTRLRDRQDEVENAVDLMFRCSKHYAKAGEHSRLLVQREKVARLHPMTFVSCGSTNLWSGRSPGNYKRMLSRAQFKPVGATLHATAWVLWGTVSPRSLRMVLRLVLTARNRLVRPILKGREVIEWRPRGSTDGRSATAGEPARAGIRSA